MMTSDEDEYMDKWVDQYFDRSNVVVRHYEGYKPVGNKGVNTFINCIAFHAKTSLKYPNDHFHVINTDEPFQDLRYVFSKPNHSTAFVEALKKCDFPEMKIVSVEFTDVNASQRHMDNNASVKFTMTQELDGTKSLNPIPFQLSTVLKLNDPYHDMEMSLNPYAVLMDTDSVPIDGANVPNPVPTTRDVPEKRSCTFSKEKGGTESKKGKIEGDLNENNNEDERDSPLQSVHEGSPELHQDGDEKLMNIYLRAIEDARVEMDMTYFAACATNVETIKGIFQLKKRNEENVSKFMAQYEAQLAKMNRYHSQYLRHHDNLSVSNPSAVLHTPKVPASLSRVRELLDKHVREDNTIIRFDVKFARL